MGASARVPGTLYVVATPLGNLADLTPRAAETLRQAAVVAAEDTRRTRPLLAYAGSRARLVSFHAHSPPGAARRLLALLREGRNVALVSDAGTPAISDPGAALVRAARDAGVAVVPVPGPTAVAAALSGAGFPADRFLFLGFLPRRGGERRRLLERVAASEWTVVLFEAANRLPALLADLAQTAGALSGRRAAVARELTKKFEEFREGTVAELAAFYAAHPARGEVTIVVEGSGTREPKAGSTPAGGRSPLERARELVEQGMTKTEAARILAGETGLSRNDMYKLLMSL